LRGQEELRAFDFIEIQNHLHIVGKFIAKSMTEGEEEHCVMVYHYLESDFGSTKMQIKSVDRSPRLKQ